MLSEDERLNICRRRNVEPSVLPQLLQANIDSIVTKCLQKDPDQRYQSVMELDGAVQRCSRSIPEELPRGLKTRWWLLLVIGLTVGTGEVWFLDHHPDASNPQHGSGSEMDQITPEKRAFLNNQRIYLKAKNASDASTFEGAKIILDQIEMNDISDPDVASYVAISKKIAEFCPKVGIPRSADPTWSGIIKGIDLVALATQMLQSPLETIKIGLEIKKQIPEYDRLSIILEARYGKE
jgi:serine/threonine protein kinase